MRRFSIVVLLISLIFGSVNAQIFHRNISRKAEKALFGKSHSNKKEVKVKEPKAVLKAKKKQESNDKRLKKEYAESIAKSRKRTFDIQSTEVQSRMKQNQKDSINRDKTKKKKDRSSTRKAGRKFK